MSEMLIYFAIVIFIPIFISIRVQIAYKQQSKIKNSSGKTGFEIAREILRANGLDGVVRVEMTDGFLSDHYDPRKKVVRLSRDNFKGTSISAAAVAAHEVGHAIQDAERYSFLRMRTTLVPLASFGSYASFVIIIAGIILSSTNLLVAGVAFMSLSVLFQVVTLPVEFNASSRARDQLIELGILNNLEENGAKKVLNAAALTYVAAAAVSLLELLRFILIIASSD